MYPYINVLEQGIPVTRQMTGEEYAEYQQLLQIAREESHGD